MQEEKVPKTYFQLFLLRDCSKNQLQEAKEVFACYCFNPNVKLDMAFGKKERTNHCLGFKLSKAKSTENFVTMAASHSAPLIVLHLFPPPYSSKAASTFIKCGFHF